MKVSKKKVINGSTNQTEINKLKETAKSLTENLKSKGSFLRNASTAYDVLVKSDAIDTIKDLFYAIQSYEQSYDSTTNNFDERKVPFSNKDGMEFWE